MTMTGFQKQILEENKDAINRDGDKTSALQLEDGTVALSPSDSATSQKSKGKVPLSWIMSS